MSCIKGEKLMNHVSLNRIKNCYFLLALFLFVIFQSATTFAQGMKPNSDYKMKLVFPFGEMEKHNSSVCDMPYRTLDGCCEPPNAVYTHDSRIGCCRTPNETHTRGTNTRCCAPATISQSRWNQTETSPCGQFCTQPSAVLNSFGKSSCCPSCTGSRWNQTATSICGECCTGTSNMSYVGAYSSCCAALPVNQERWGQTTSSVCGGYCPPASSIFSYATLNSCCSSCAEVIAFQSSNNVCGTCCSKVPNACGSAGYRVCVSDTGSAYCSSDITKCVPPTDWITGTSGEGGFSCCASCAGIRYNHTSSVCGSCCPAASQTIAFGGKTDCCQTPTANEKRWSQTAAAPCGKLCSTNLLLSVGTTSSCCPALAAGQTRYNQTTANVCGQTCSAPNQVLAFGGSTSCCASCAGTRYGQTASSVCGVCCQNWQAYNATTKACYQVRCVPGSKFQVTLNIRTEICNRYKYQYFLPGNYKFQHISGCWAEGGKGTWQARNRFVGWPPMPNCGVNERWYWTQASCEAHIKNNPGACTTYFTVTTSSNGAWMHQDGNCGDNNGYGVFEFTCLN